MLKGKLNCYVLKIAAFWRVDLVDWVPHANIKQPSETISDSGTSSIRTN